MKPGYKTTEFWLTMVANTIGMAYATGLVSPSGEGQLSKGIAIGAAVLATLGYSVSRGIAKRNSTPHK